MRKTQRALATAALAAAAVLAGTASAQADVVLPAIPEGQTLYGIGWADGEGNTLYTISNDGSLTEVGPLGIDAFVTAADLDPVTGIAYAVTDVDFENRSICDELYTVDLDTGEATLIGALPDSLNCGDVDIDADGVFRMLQWSNPPAADVHVIDPTAAAFSAHLQVNVDFHYETTWSFLASQSDSSMIAGNFSNEFYRLDLDTPDAFDVFWGATIEEEGGHHPDSGPSDADFDADDRLWGVRWMDAMCEQELVSTRVTDIAGTSVVQGDLMAGGECVDIYALFFGPAPDDEEAAAPALAETGVEATSMLVASLGALALGVVLMSRRWSVRSTR